MVTRSMLARSKPKSGSATCALERAHIALQGLGDDDRLLENLLAHEMGVIALVDALGRGAGVDDLAFDRTIVAVEDLHAVAAQHRPVALVEIGDPLRQRRQRQRVGAEVILALAITDGQRRPHARADDQIGMIAEQEGDARTRRAAAATRRRPRPAATRRARSSRATRWATTSLSVSDCELRALGDQLVAQRLEILDDAVVDQRHRRRRCADGRCRPSARHASPSACGRCRRRRRAARRPARGRDCRACPRPGGARSGRRDGADAGAVIAAIFEPLAAHRTAAARPAPARQSRQFRTLACSSFFACWRLRNLAAQPASPRCSPRATARLVGGDILGDHRAGADDRAGADR